MLGYFARFVFMLSPLVGFSMVAQAEDVSIVLRVSPQRVNVGDTLQATIEVEGAQGDDIEMPDFDGFEIVSRQVHSSVQVQFGFGSGKKIQPSLVYRLTLRALEPGNFVIGPARVSGNQAHSETQRVVVGSNPGASSAVPQHAAPTQEPPAATDADPIAFLRTVVTPQQPFVGQQITVSIYLYSRRPIVDHGVRAEKPEMQGFWVHDLSAESRPLRTQIGNKTYRVYEVLRYAAFPLRDGPLQIGSSSASIVTGGLGFFEPTRQIERSAPSVNVEVSPLPEPRPANPIVGLFEIEARLDRQQVRTGDAATLSVVISGSGNIRNLSSVLKDTPGLRILDPTIEDHIDTQGNVVVGARKGQWLIVAERPGRYEVQIEPLRYFDPAAQEYKTLQVEALPLEVSGEIRSEASDSEITPSAPSATPNAAAPRFGPVRLRSQLQRRKASLTEQKEFKWALAAPWFALFIGLAIIGIRARRREYRAQEGKLRRHYQRLSHARELAQQGNPRAFYDEASRVLLESLSEALDIAALGYTHQELAALLESRGWDEDLRRRIQDELSGHDFARFSSSGVSVEEMRACAERVEVLIARMQNQASEEKP